MEKENSTKQEKIKIVEIYNQKRKSQQNKKQ